MGGMDMGMMGMPGGVMHGMGMPGMMPYGHGMGGEPRQRRCAEPCAAAQSSRVPSLRRAPWRERASTFVTCRAVQACRSSRRRRLGRRRPSGSQTEQQRNVPSRERSMLCCAASVPLARVCVYQYNLFNK
jgi:hypothetical protein